MLEEDLSNVKKDKKKPNNKTKSISSGNIIASENTDSGKTEKNSHIHLIPYSRYILDDSICVRPMPTLQKILFSSRNILFCVKMVPRFRYSALAECITIPQSVPSGRKSLLLKYRLIDQGIGKRWSPRFQTNKTLFNFHFCDIFIYIINKFNHHLHSLSKHFFIVIISLFANYTIQKNCCTGINRYSSLLYKNMANELINLLLLLQLHL